MSVLVCDIETYPNYLLVAFKRLSDGRIFTMEESDRSTIDRDRLRKILRSNTIVTYNGMAFDIPLIYYFLGGASYRKVKAACDRIIEGRVRYWDVENLLGIRIPRDLDHIDLIEVQPNPFASLKGLNARMHGRLLQDLPYEPNRVLTHAEMDEVTAYCINDLQATEDLFNALREPLEMRRVIGEDLGIDLRSKSDTQVGLAIIKNRAERLLKRRIEKVPVNPGTGFPYRPPGYLKFETPRLQEVLRRVREHEFIVKDDGKVDLPKFLSDPVIVGETAYAMGIGGLHSTESKRAVVADDNSVLLDADVGGYYPAIILTMDMFPPAIGKDFTPIFQSIYDDRIAAKRAKDKARDKGLKICLNGGGFGNLGNRYSIVYAPHLLIAVTLTGQLALLMLIERAERAGIPVVSANTDGVVFRCPREDFDGVDGIRLKPSALAEITDQWERDTGFGLEFAEYRALYNQSVNSYFALRADGGHKRKGPLAVPWSKHPDDFDPRAQLMKNPQATICSDAALAFIKDGTPIEETIYGCSDIRQFVTVIKSDGGATWRGKYLGKVVRYYWATDGEEILKAKPHAKTGNYAKVPKTEGAAPCMTLPDELPDDVDFDRYLRETREILMTLGHVVRPPAPEKAIRLTKANRAIVLAAWAQAA